VSDLGGYSEPGTSLGILELGANTNLLPCIKTCLLLLITSGICLRVKNQVI
jgi:hypothetical protein